MSLRLRLKLAARVLLGARAPTTPRISSNAEDEGPASIPTTQCPEGPIVELTECPACGCPERTLVSEFNRFVLLEWRPDDASAKYDYMLCHRCGIAYASRRPLGPRYRWLLEHFEESLGRDHTSRAAAKLTSSVMSLSDDEKRDLQKRASRGVFVSDHLGLGRKEYLPLLLGDRLQNSAHVELLGSLLTLHEPEVLEVRSRAGSIGASLTRLYGGNARAMCLFENQRFVIEAIYGIETKAPIDFEGFTIPWEDTFDLIVANHMFTHALTPRRFFAEVRSKLSPTGHLYLYNEPDDASYLHDSKSVLGSLNAFHLQAFDGPSLTRALAANGFAVRFLTRADGHFLCLAAPDPQASVSRIEPDHLRARLERYCLARDKALLAVPSHSRGLVAKEWHAAAERLLTAGMAEVRNNGEIRLTTKRR